MAEKVAAKSPGNMWEQAYDQIKDLILSLRINPGEIVSENSLSKLIGMSRTPIREALKRLEQDGLVFEENRRKKVYILTVEDIDQIFGLKEMVEGGISHWAAERGNRDFFDRLKKVVATMKRIAASRPSDPNMLEEWYQQWLESDRSFHVLLAEAAGNRRAKQIVDNLNLQWHRLRLGILAIEGRIEKSLIEHEKIAAAIIAGKPEDAERATREHLENLKVMLVGIMKAFSFPMSSGVSQAAPATARRRVSTAGKRKSEGD